MKAYIKLLRPDQWLKSIFVLFGICYAQAWNLIPQALIAFVAFSLAASAVYIYNDICDRISDKQHPNKRFRPIASGDVSLVEGWGLIVFLLIGTYLLSGYVSCELMLIITSYFLINIAYNHGLKNLPVADVLCITSGFILRMLAGTVGIGIVYSRWLLVSVSLLSFLIAISKRLLEKKLQLSNKVRPVLLLYTHRILILLIYLSSFGAVVSYLVYIIAVHRDNIGFVFTIPFALFGIYRFVMLMKNSIPVTDDPIFMMIRDSLMQVCLLGFIIGTFYAVLGI